MNYAIAKIRLTCSLVLSMVKVSWVLTRAWFRIMLWSYKRRKLEIQFNKNFINAVVNTTKDE